MASDRSKPRDQSLPPAISVQELFDDPHHATAVLRAVAGRYDAPASVSSILLDNATVDHAMRFFSGVGQKLPGTGLSTRHRLTLLAVAEFVNAAVLYEKVLTGPERAVDAPHRNDPLIRPAWQVVRTALDDSLSGAETFAVLALAKATALESTRGQNSIAAIGALLNVDLREELVSIHLRQISPSSAMYSPPALQYPRTVFNDESYYDFSLATLSSSRDEITAVNWGDDDASWMPYLSSIPYFSSYTRGIPLEGVSRERFAAHLIYRTHVYLLLADLFGCPYSADALRSELVEQGPSRGFAERVTALVGDAELARDRQVNDLLGYDAFEVRIPLVLKHVLSRAKRPAEVLEITLETRDSRPARRFREYCARVDTQGRCVLM